MRGILAVGAAVAATALVGQVARATLSISLVPVVISSQARTADSTLNNARTFDVDVTQTGEQFAVADLQFSLVNANGLTGTFYAPTNHSDTPIGVSSLSMGTGSLAANLAYDTYFTTPQYGTTGGTLETDGSQSAVTIAGGSDYPVSPAPASAITAANMQIPSTFRGAITKPPLQLSRQPELIRSLRLPSSEILARFLTVMSKAPRPTPR